MPSSPGPPPHSCSPDLRVSTRTRTTTAALAGLRSGGSLLRMEAHLYPQTHIRPRPAGVLLPVVPDTMVEGPLQLSHGSREWSGSDESGGSLTPRRPSWSPCRRSRRMCLLHPPERPGVERRKVLSRVTVRTPCGRPEVCVGREARVGAVSVAGKRSGPGPHSLGLWWGCESKQKLRAVRTVPGSLSSGPKPDRAQDPRDSVPRKERGPKCRSLDVSTLGAGR